MLKPYLTTYEFFYNGERMYSRNVVRIEKEGQNFKISGDDFSGLWDLIKEWNALIPATTWTLKKNQRAIELWGDSFSVVKEKKNNCKPWSFVVSSEETTISMKKLMEFNVEVVIEYLKERGITSYPIIK